MKSTRNRRKPGLWTVTSLVAGNMIGSGIFLLPSSLAEYGGISLIGWLVSMLGTFTLALIFSRMSRIFPGKGGPYLYTKMGFGDFTAFLVVWGYWISIWTGIAAITVAFTSYLSVFIPSLSTNSVLAVFISLVVIWSLTAVNIKGVREAGVVSVVTTVLKITPIIIICLIGVFYFEPAHFTPFNTSNESSFDAILITSSLTLWAFLGFETGTVPADEIDNSKRNIPLGTLLGTGIAAFVYIISTFAIFGLVSPAELQTSNAPFADAVRVIFGEPGRYLIALTAIISTLGALNGWILIQGQVPLAAANDHAFPGIFGKTGKQNTPYAGLIISSLLVSLMIVMNYTRGFVSAFKFMILLATLTNLIPYIFTAGAYLITKSKKGKSISKNLSGHILLGSAGFFFSLWAIAGSGSESVFWGFILLLMGIPVYIYVQAKNRSRTR